MGVRARVAPQPEDGEVEVERPFIVARVADCPAHAVGALVRLVVCGEGRGRVEAQLFNFVKVNMSIK